MQTKKRWLILAIALNSCFSSVGGYTLADATVGVGWTSCTLGQDFWKDNPEVWPPGLAGSAFFLSGVTWHGVFEFTWTDNDCYYGSSQAWIAALLNGLIGPGTVPSTVTASMNKLEDWFEEMAPVQMDAGGFCSSQVKKEWDEVSNYNNGLTGPGTCACDPNEPCDEDPCTADWRDAVTGVCQFPPVECTELGPCFNGACNPISGSCGYVPMDCGDDDPCTLDSCSEGQCAHEEISCSDENPCTVDACSDGDCIHEEIVCFDGDLCTDDFCSGGQCVFERRVCPDPIDPCTEGVCDSLTGQCANVTRGGIGAGIGLCWYNCTVGAGFWQINPDLWPAALPEADFFLSSDTWAGVFNHTSWGDGCYWEIARHWVAAYLNRAIAVVPADVNAAILAVQQAFEMRTPSAIDSDAEFCAVTGESLLAVLAEFNSGSLGVPECAADLPCDSNPCTIDYRDPVTGECQVVPKDCEDGNPCSEDRCCPFTGECYHDPVECTDGNRCTQDLCVAELGGCIYVPIVCDDDDPCTVIDFCDPASGACAYVEKSCDDGIACTADSCVGGECVFNATECLVSSSSTGVAPIFGESGSFSSTVSSHQASSSFPSSSSSLPMSSSSDRNPSSFAESLSSYLPTSSGGITFSSTVSSHKSSSSFPMSSSSLPMSSSSDRNPSSYAESLSPYLPTSSGGITFSSTVSSHVASSSFPRSSSSLPMSSSSDRNPSSFAESLSSHLPISSGGITFSSTVSSHEASSSFPMSSSSLPMSSSSDRNPSRLSPHHSTFSSTVSSFEAQVISSTYDDPCDDQNPCTVDEFDRELHRCSNRPKNCSDDDRCTIDFCDPTLNGECMHVERNCGLLDPCSVGWCDRATGQCARSDRDCDDGIACTIDICGPLGCRHVMTDVCDDDPCTEDFCIYGFRVNVPLRCNDRDPCSVDSCVEGKCTTAERESPRPGCPQSCSACEWYSPRDARDGPCFLRDEFLHPYEWIGGENCCSSSESSSSASSEAAHFANFVLSTLLSFVIKRFL